jgi:predicted O-linked N-acetylglucosamine transferase (SPINDLY family)
MYDHVWARIAKGLQAAGNKSRWARIAARLRGAGNGRLVFFHSGYSAMDQRLAGRLRRAFDREQVDFDARVRIIPYLDRAHFFGLMQQATLLLDTLGFSGFNNALQAVEAGLPVLAREGEFLRGRLASGIMRRLNLPELVAGSDEDFIAKAIELAGNPASLDALRARILERRAVLFQDLEPVRALERWLTASIK